MRYLVAIIAATLLATSSLAAVWSGDQVISGTQVYSGEAIVCSGNISITGELLLTNGSRLEMDSAVDGGYSITVQNGGEFNLLNHSITTAQDISKRYNIFFEAGSSGSIESSTIEHTYGDDDEDTLDGFVIKTSNFTVNNSIIQNSNSSGITISNSNAGQSANNINITNSTIRNNQGYGILVAEGSQDFLIENTTIEGNVSGIKVRGQSSGEVSNNTISSNEVSGLIVTEESTVYVHDNSFINNPETGITIDNSDPIISNNLISGGAIGVQIQNSGNPSLGNLDNASPDDDGGNTFTGQTNKAVQNDTQNIIKIENNNWGTDEANSILNLIGGQIDLYPILDNIPPQILLMSLNSATNLTGNASIEISWSASDGLGLATEPINLYYSLDNGSNYNSIITGQANTGSYNWTVPNTVTTSGLIKIEAIDSSDNIATAESSTFSIALGNQTISSETGVIVMIPSGATNNTVSLTVEVASSPPGEIPTTKTLISNIFTIQSTTTAFSQAISITLPRTQGYLGSLPHYWTGLAWSSSGLTVTSYTSTTITFSSAGLGTFAVMANNQSFSGPVAAPNPFDPTSQTTKLTYWLDQAAVTKIYIFEIDGTLIWQNQYAPTDPEGGHANYNMIEWNGTNHFGEVVPNGVYIFRIISNGREIGRGKIIAYPQ